MRYLVAALLLHAALLGIVLVGVYFHPVRRPDPVIEAVLLKPKSVAAAPAPVERAPRKEEPKPVEDAQKKERERQQQAELQRKAEQQKKLKLEQQDQERKRLEAEKKLRQQEEQERRKQLEEEARRLEEQQRLQKEAEQRQQQALNDMLEQEREGRKASERSRWAALIQDKVRRNWIRPINSIEKFQCSVNVQILPGGNVVDVKLRGSCGSPALDESVRRAVLKSDPLPMPSDPSVFERNLNFTFVPGPN